MVWGTDRGVEISSLDDFLEDFPGVSREQAEAVIDWAGKWCKPSPFSMKVLLDEKSYSIYTKMTSEAFYISVFSACVSMAGFLFNFLTYLAKLKLDQANNIAKLHEKWWSDEFQSSRKKLYAVVKDWNFGENSGAISQKFLDFYLSPSEESDEAIEAFSKIVFFFSDVNVYIDESLISTRLAYRLLGDSQYAWFRDIIFEVRKRINIKNAQTSLQMKRRIRWVEETKALENKFDRYLKRIKLLKQLGL